MPISAIFSGTGSGRSLVEREPVTALAKPSILGVLALLAAVAVHANDTELVCSLTSQQASGIVAGVLYCGQEGGDSPLLLMCTSGSRTAMLRGGEAAGAEAEVALTLPDAEPLIAMWEVRDRLLVYDADAPGDDVTDNLLATIAEGAPLTYSVGDQQFSYTFAVTVPNYVRRGTLAMTFERVCGLLQPEIASRNGRPTTDRRPGNDPGGTAETLPGQEAPAAGGAAGAQAGAAAQGRPGPQASGAGRGERREQRDPASGAGDAGRAVLNWVSCFAP